MDPRIEPTALRCGRAAGRAQVSAIALVAALAVAFASRGVFASPRDFTGSTACGTCHPRELAAWQTTAHATTRTRFAARPEARCLGCHGTGEAPAGVAVAVEVGCEACHGAGAAYAPDDIMRDRPVALALGLADVSTPKLRAQLCMTCHARMTSSRSFDAGAPVHPIASAP